MRSFKKLLFLFCILCSIFWVQELQARGKIYGLTFMGTSWQSPGFNSSFWNVQCWFDSLLKQHRYTNNGFQLDTVINLWSNGVQYGNNQWYHPRFRRPFVSDTASNVKFALACQYLRNRMDSGDILMVMFGGHGNYWDNNSRIDAYDQFQDLWDSTAARWLNPIPCTLRLFFGWSCQFFGNGRHPDSSGFATTLVYQAPSELRNKTIFFSEAGPQPAWSPGLADDRRVSGGQYWLGFENPWWNNSQYHWIEGVFAFQTCFSGGVEPSYYWQDSVSPGFYHDSIDLAPQDWRISTGECSTWYYKWHSQLGWSSGRILDFGRKINRFCLYPYIGFIDSLDALPTALFLPETVFYGAFVRPLVRVKNLGFTSSNIPVRLRIGATYNHVRTKTIGPNREDTLFFPTWQALSEGFHPSRCSTELFGDENPRNDLLIDSIYVLPPGAIEEMPITIAEIPIPIPKGLMTIGRFRSELARLQDKQRVKIYDPSGRSVAIQDIRQGMYFLRMDDGRVLKVVIIP